MANLCRESARKSRGTGKPAANRNLESMVVPIESPTANPISQTDDEVHANPARSDVFTKLAWNFCCGVCQTTFDVVLESVCFVLFFPTAFLAMFCVCVFFGAALLS